MEDPTIPLSMHAKYGCAYCADRVQKKCNPFDGVCRYAPILDQFETYAEYDEEMLRDALSMRVTFSNISLNERRT